MLFDRARDLFLGHHPNNAFLFLPISEQNQARYAANAVSSGNGWAVIDVELYEAYGPCVLPRYRFDNRRERPARPAPFRPEVHQHRNLRVQRNAVEIRLVDFLDILTHLRSPPPLIVSTIAFVMHPSAASSDPCRCMSTKSLLPSASMNVTVFNTTRTGRSLMTA